MDKEFLELIKKGVENGSIKVIDGDKALREGTLTGGMTNEEAEAVLGKEVYDEIKRLRMNRLKNNNQNSSQED
jgi:hypothetical protein